MERKFHQEKALREVAETRVKALKKKIRVYETTNGVPSATTTTTTTTNGSGGSSTSQNHIHPNPNETSMDMGYSGGSGSGVIVGGTTSTNTTRDDESVGTYQTYDKQSQPPYSDQIQWTYEPIIYIHFPISTYMHN